MGDVRDKDMDKGIGKAGAAPVGDVRLGAPEVREAVERLRKSVGLYGTVSAIVLGTLAVTAALGASTTPFMWVRAVLLLALTPLVHHMAADVGRGSRRAYERLGTLTVVLPVALIGVDLVPGLCPPWYAAMQGVSALALVLGATVLRGAVLRGVFPKAA